MTKPAINKLIIFYILMIAINIFGLGVLGISFLGSSNANGEGSPILTETESFLRHATFIAVLSLIFAGLTLLLSIIFRKIAGLNKVKLIKIFLIEFCSFIVIYFLVYGYIYIRYTT